MIQAPVSDAGPIISFARAGRLELLNQVLPLLILPEVVFDELTVKGASRPGADAVEQGRTSWIQIRPLTDQATLAQAIALALELGAELLVDERAGRAEARRLSVPLLSTLTVLRVACRPLGLIPKVKPVLDHLIQTGGFRLSKALYTQFLQDLGEGWGQEVVIFDIGRAAAEYEVSPRAVERIKAEVAEEFSPDEILFELQVIRRIHQIAQEKMGLFAWLEQSARRSQQYYRDQGFIERQTP